MDLTIIKDTILCAGWIFAVIATIYILLKGKMVLKLVKGSIIGRLAVGLMIGFFIESYSVLILCTASSFSANQDICIVLPIFVLWFVTFVYCWVIMRKTREDAEKITNKK